MTIFACISAAGTQSATLDPNVEPNDPRLIARPAGSPGAGGSEPGIVGPSLTILFTCPSGDCGDDLLAGLPSDGSDDVSCQVNGADIFLCDFINESGHTLTSLILNINPGGGLVSCPPIFGFAQCDVSQEGGPTAPTILSLSGGTGIRNLTGFGFTFEDWPTNIQVEGVFNAPEPSTWILFLFALCMIGTLVLRRPRPE